MIAAVWIAGAEIAGGVGVAAVLGALAIGLALGLLGSGGSILTVPILVYLLQHEEKAAIAESLAIVGAISLVSAVRARMAGLLDVRSAVFFGLPGMAGTFAGAYLAHWVPGTFQLIVLALVMLSAAGLMSVLRGARPRGVPRPSGAWVVVLGAGVGIITGLVGVGGGFLIVPAMVLLMGLPIASAVGTSLAVIAANSGVGFVKYQNVLAGQNLAVDWTTIVLFILLGTAGAVAGGMLGGRLSPAVLRRIFAVFLVIMAGYILYREAPGLIDPRGQESGIAGTGVSTLDSSVQGDRRKMIRRREPRAGRWPLRGERCQES